MSNYLKSEFSSGLSLFCRKLNRIKVLSDSHNLRILKGKKLSDLKSIFAGSVAMEADADML